MVVLRDRLYFIGCPGRTCLFRDTHLSTACEGCWGHKIGKGHTRQLGACIAENVFVCLITISKLSLHVERVDKVAGILEQFPILRFVLRQVSLSMLRVA